MKKYIALALVNILIIFLLLFMSPIQSGIVMSKEESEGTYYILVQDQYFRKQSIAVSENAWNAAQVGDTFSRQCICIMRPK